MNAHDRIISQINRNVGQFKVDSYPINQKKYEKQLFAIDISIEKKRKVIMKNLHDLVIKTFSINPKIHNKKAIITGMKGNIDLIRGHVIKLRDLNYYLHSTLLEEVGMKKISKSYFSSKNIKKDLKRMEIKKKDIIRLNTLTLAMLKEVISLDSKLIKGYKINEMVLERKEKYEIKDFDRLLGKESELLCHLEAKLPPPKSIKLKLLGESIFSHWVSRILAILAEIEVSFEASESLFKKLKKRESFKYQLVTKISKLMKERQHLLKMQEREGWRNENWHRIMHHFAATTRL
ncbi:hypothetical protein ACFLZX_06035 [Nanoarchaeota archaeon]